VAAVVALAAGLTAPGAAAGTVPSWAIQSIPNPSGAVSSELYGVSCSSATACTAVGEYENSSAADETLAEQWNGTTWAIQSTPNPSGAQFPELTGVSCSSATACTAVGYYTSSDGAFVTLAERWNGTTWAIQPTPNPSGGDNMVLNGVSCSSATACTAAGEYETSSGSERPLAEQWNGTKWAVQSTPNPSGGHDVLLYGVSCSSATACTAAGNYVASDANERTLAERWNGTTWAIQPTPNPSGALRPEADVVLYGVSCSSATACTTAGFYANKSGVAVTLAEAWNGTKWAIQPTRNPSGAQGSDLAAVSCSTATACTAAAYYTNSSGVERALAERYS
jgi:hypothetical protein